jgi:enoyl-CoA hydratase
MWVYRLGPQMAKRMMMTGDLIDGREAVRIGLALEAVPEAALDDAVDRLAGRLRGVPKNQLMMTKTVVNQAYDNMGLNTTQMFATLFDGVSRHSPEGIWFRERAQEVGFKQAVAERDSGDPIASQVSKRMPKED